MPQAFTQVDAFTDRPFAGNPAAVCVLPGPDEPDSGWMQNIGREMNLSETAFLRRLGAGEYALRWFTPTVEVDLCGHATLASAHALWSEGHVAGDQPIRFRTRSGLLTATRAGCWIDLDFPAEPVAPAALTGALSEALGTGVALAFTGRNRFDALALLESEAALRALTPDFSRLAALPVRGVIATARAESATGFDFVSRFFAPQSGVPEDPVTGSAHCALGPFWGERLAKAELVGYQASVRGGVVRVRLAGDRVGLGGQAVTVLRGEILVGPPPSSA